MSVYISPLGTFLLIVTCCSYASIATAAQAPSVVFSFGDSLSDTGNGIRMFNSLLLPAAFQPFGSSYFGQGTGRSSDGRALIDCIVQSLGLRFLNPVFDFVGTDFSNGANYAVAGCTALEYSTMAELGFASETRYTFADQLRWHLSFLEYAEAGIEGVTRFPKMSAIRQGLYFIMIGGNDHAKLFLQGSSAETLSNTSQLILAKVTEAVQLLYEHGARNFILTSMFPMGCSPSSKYLSNSDVDDRGCITKLNDLLLNYSTSVAAISESLSETLPNASVVFLDLYSAFDEMFTYPDRYGIVDTLNVCCGAANVPAASLVNGFTKASICVPASRVCEDPNTYLNWDGYHFTDNTVRQIVNMFVEGKFITPSDALSKFGAAKLSKALRSGHS